LARVPLREGDPSRVGRYRLAVRLGAGGMGVVYLGAAKDGSQVAVKVLRPELADDTEFRARFSREVATLARVNGVCTVRVIEADTDSPRPFLVTEYADGPSLAEYIEAYGPLGADMLYGLATGLAEALTAIHAAGVVHRDLKPSNVILTDGGPKVIDFGIAQTLDSTAVTKTGTTVGSAGFMAPEQIMGRAGPAADIFAWAVTIGYAASGQPPFGTGASDAILYRILHGEPDISAVPSPLRPLVEAALAKDPQSRPEAHQLLDRLANTSAHADSSYDTPTQTVLSRTWQLTAPGNALPPARQPARRRPVLLAGALSLAVLAAGAVIAVMAARHPGTTNTSGLHPLAATHAAAKSTRSSPATVTRSDNTRAAAVANLWNRGRTPLPGSPAWHTSAPLNVIIATSVGSADGGEQAYFFANGKYIGTDTADTSTGISASRLAGDIIVIHYALYNTSDPRCCPTGGEDSVRFFWTGTHLLALDPIPSFSRRKLPEQHAAFAAGPAWADSYVDLRRHHRDHEGDHRPKPRPVA
jgi:serine/threonine protein kinase